MDLEAARERLAAHIKEHFGRIVELRDVAVVRTASGRTWSGSLFCVTRHGDVAVGTASLDENGRLVHLPDVDDLYDALWSVRPLGDGVLNAGGGTVEEGGESFESEMDFSEITEEDSGEERKLVSSFDELEKLFVEEGPDDLARRIDELIGRGEPDDLVKARRLLPRLLSEAGDPGPVLRRMGDLELNLGAIDLGLEYLEAAARSFADRADVSALEDVAERVMQTLGVQDFAEHPVRLIMAQTRTKLRPVEAIEQIPVLAGLPGPVVREIEDVSDTLMVRAGEDVLTEGALALRAYIVRSGVLSVRLEAGGEGSRFVRCCFPGEFIGESSVLGARGATCNATVRAERLSALWGFEGTRLGRLMQKYPVLRARIESARALHRLDTFFSMNQSTSTLDTRVRDRLLGCVVSVRHAALDEVLGVEGQEPEMVYLIAQGKVEKRHSGKLLRTYEADSFVGLRDTLYRLPSEGTLVAAEPSRLVAFDPQGLQKFAAEAPVEVVAVLERLE